MQKFENYRFEGEIYRAALLQLPKVASLTMKEKIELRSAYKFGWWLGIGVQFPVVIAAMWFFKRVVPGFKAEGKMLSYTATIGLYGMFHMFTKAWAWHYAHARVEPIIKDYIVNADIDEIRKIHEEQALGITKDTQVYLPKS